MKLEHDWYDAPLPANVEVGDRSWIYSSFAFLHCRSRRRVRIGNDSGIYHGTFFELGPDAEVDIGDHTLLVGTRLVVNGRLEIGDFGLFSYQVTIADSPWATPFGSRIARPGPATVVGDNVWCGVGAFLRAGIHVGDDAVIGARSVVTEDVPAGAMVVGNPARILRQPVDAR